MKKKVVLAGGTGFIGHYLNGQFAGAGYDVKVISRGSKSHSWDRFDSVVEAIEGSDMLINLAGKSVNCRYNEKNKAEIFSSRTDTTEMLGKAVLKCVNPPSLWINSSTATIYRHAEDRPMTEENGEIGSGFSVEVAKAWEKSFFSFDLPNTRQAALRIAIVLGDGGVMTPYKNLAKFGLGGVQGSGKQMFSWIHVEDVYRIIQFIRENEHLSGVFNTAAPKPISNKEFMSEVRKAMNIKFGLPSPKWMLGMGAVFIRTETELVLKSRWVIPERLEREGFTFKYPDMESALGEILGEGAR
ncbi:TIGR01777 family oxidoreductase [Metabacillus sp. KIGAM252]|uniref:TIGR01777 family oxidoreductase n=1 Tax=Metabacillus flavus TaxID=2823519 RepID=A0ABS5LBP2_9BACI|nr:TIGR01777 family oxidoreductase [Metabacillus flavus]MBS2967879.1 TIGR01777 family oxidoreductase [Metabacillus flavus]